MNFQGVVMNVADLNRSIDFYREVLGFTLLSQKEQLAAVSAPGSDRTSGHRVASVWERSLSEELAISVCEPSYWKSSQPINWSGSRVSWTPGDSSSAGVITASGLPW